ncbi:MAG: TolC family protein [Planctomycetota bacterium]
METRILRSTLWIFLMLLFLATSAPGQDSGQIPPVVQEGESTTEIHLSLDEAVRIALERNLDVRIEHLTRNKSRSDITIASAAFDPLFSTSYTMSKLRSPTVDFLAGVGAALQSTVVVNPSTNQNVNVGLSGLLQTGTTYSLSLFGARQDNPESAFFSINPRHNTRVRAEITQPLLKGFGLNANLADLRIARHNAEISEHRLRRLWETTVADVNNAYWTLVFAREDLRVKEEGMREAEQLLEINRHKVAVGTAKEIDIIDAEANIQNQKSGIIDAKNQIRQAQDDLLDLLNYQEILNEEQSRNEHSGHALYVDVQVIPSSRLEYEEFPVGLEDAIFLALNQRHDLQEAELQISNARLEYNRRKNQRLPSLDVRGTWTQQGLEGNLGNSTDELFSGRFYNWTLGVTFEYPLGNRREKNLFFQAGADLESSDLSYERLRNSIILQVTQAVRNIDAAAQRIETTRATTRLRGEQLEGEKQRLRVGSSTSYNVLQVQNDLLEAQIEEVRSGMDYKNAITAFKVAVGTIIE